MKVLFLGHCSYYTVLNLAAAIKRNTEDVKITVADLVKPGGGNLTEVELKKFDEVISLPRKRNIKFGLHDELNETINILKDKRIKILLKNLIFLKIGSLKKYIKSETEERKYSTQMREILKKYDVLHFHYIVPGYLNPLNYVDKSKKIIFSYWGSDLFQLDRGKYEKKVYEALGKADYITINTREMQDYFYDKFGKGFSSKVRSAYFILNEKKFEEIKLMNKPDTLHKFKLRNKISTEKKIITIGYNGSSKQKHIEILEILGELDGAVKEKLHIIIPMAYGLEFEAKDYADKVKEAASKTGIGNTIISEYMSSEELIEFVIGSEIKLNLRDTDSMNASLIESLAAGNIVVNGAWLPYGKLERLGIEYKKIERLEDLKEVIPEILKNYEKERIKAERNYQIIRNFFSEENLIVEWKKIYDEIKIELDKKII